MTACRYLASSGQSDPLVEGRKYRRSDGANDRAHSNGPATLKLAKGAYIRTCFVPPPNGAETKSAANT